MELSDLLKSTREYFWDLQFDEVEIPYLNESLPLEPNIYAFKIRWSHTQKDYFLPASPEFALKKYLAEKRRNCFAISHCFRDLETAGPHHRPEFLMLEYYLVNKNLVDLQKSLQDYIGQFIKTDFTEFKLPQNFPDNEPDFNQYFLNEVEPSLPRDAAVFVTGYPAFLSPLAKTAEPGEVRKFSAHSEREALTKSKRSPKVAGTEKFHAQAQGEALRFELYLNGIEIANGCEENRDSGQILAAFKKESDYRRQNNLPVHPFSRNFIVDSSNLPPSSGVGIGLERLLMVINGRNSI